MNSSESKVLYSFRRCPYAMRARLALASTRMPLELREVLLRDKPASMLAASPKGTVPVLVFGENNVLEERLDIINWSLGVHDPEGLLNYSDAILQEMRELVAENDGPFKNALDRYKYPNRYEGIFVEEQRSLASEFIRELDRKLQGNPYLFGDRFSFADAAILPFMRQFAHVDRDWFWAQDWRNVISWLEEFLESPRFKSIMRKYPQWKPGDVPQQFPDQA